MPGMGPAGVDTMGTSPSAVASTAGAVTTDMVAEVLPSSEDWVSLLGVNSTASSNSKRAKETIKVY